MNENNLLRTSKIEQSYMNWTQKVRHFSIKFILGYF